MILDWLFIAVFGWGTSGAALATGLGTCVGSIPPLVWFMTSRSSSLRLLAVVPAPGPVARACLNGMSEFMSNISGSLVSILFNFQLMRYVGEQGVAAYGVVMYVAFFFIAVFFGYISSSCAMSGNRVWLPMVSSCMWLSSSLPSSSATPWASVP